MPGSPPSALSVTSLPRPALAKCAAGNLENFRRAGRRLAVGFEARDPEARHRHVVDLAEVVVEALDEHPLRVGRHHFPRREIVERRAPQHGFLAAGVHRDVAADARGIGRSRIARENEAGRVGGFHRALGDDARAAAHDRHRTLDARAATLPRSGSSLRAFRC